ncbi:polysaccharide pyruvyl transferase family protein [Isoptericola sp. 4D.3]|uniref:Polysaccharide pyruvyl transferase family protein n=1 Tax=Isoptericola peretonis TaxID=2918523 RepID=A0ABT0J666_9MICO|nr:polysaccharide pyruvyl transferase family protein [Isoptericola sp. 4D.3]
MPTYDADARPTPGDPRPGRRLRLFHFDIKTYGNYGDTLLFEAVRQTFEGFAGGAAFEVAGSRSLRDPVGPKLVDHINEHYDAVVVGGGGLFLRDTNANARSGWQWNISLEQLRRLEVPIVVFAVGNNRFIDQADFAEPFREHLNLTLDKSVFFGLRNHGSVRTIREYVDHDPQRVEYQPCPTTISSYLFPDLYRERLDDGDGRVLAVESIIGKRQIAAGFDRTRIYADQADVLARLRGEGWRLVSVPHARADMLFADLLRERGLVDSERVLWGSRDVLFRGVADLADLPVILGTRGHAQMVPFGMGTIPLSLHVHHKTRYFATDLGHPEWALDPRVESFTDDLYRTVHDVTERRGELRAELAATRERLYDTTLANLATIYERLTGAAVPPSFTPLTPKERRLAARTYDVSLEKARAEERLRTTEARLGEKDAQLRSLGAEVEQSRATLRTVRASLARGSLVSRAADRARRLVRPR